MIVKEYQVTLLCTTGQYKPVSCIIKHKQNDDTDLSLDKASRKILVSEGVQKICAKRYWTSLDIKKGSYLKAKVRSYDKAKIEAKNKARYEAIKEAKYASGEWKRPKSKE